MVALTTSLCAQRQPAFEAASIKILQDMQPGRPIGGRASGSRLRLENETLTRLICYGYNIKPWQVVEGPAWATVPRGGKPISAQTRFEIVAKAEGESPRPIEDFRVMMQSLLADRFHLVVHRETRPVRVYALTVDKGGLKMKAAPPNPGGGVSVHMGGGAAAMSAKGGTVGILVNQFLNSGILDRAVVDRTGLTDTYDFNIEYTVSGPGDSGDLSAVDIFSAFPLQLGLRLTPDTVPMDVIVIDHAEPPTEN
jgi:uncharacterized protein (TIGR03435 family)